MIPNDKRGERLAPLGVSRLGISSCLGGDSPGLPQYFDPRPHEDVFAAFRGFVEQMARRCERAEEPLTRSLIGAAQLLTGDLSGADAILDHLPAQSVKLDHGAGYCLVAPRFALSTALPALPSGLKDASRWLAGSAEQAALRAWIEQHATELVWDEPRGVYVLEGQQKNGTAA